MSKTEPIQSKILSESLGYKFGTEPTFFKKINSMIAYGILEGRGVYNVTKLGVELLYPESIEMEKRLKTRAIMNVGLWKAIFEIHGKNPPKEGLWVSIKNITEVEPLTAKEYENRVYSWYMQDIALVSDEYLENKPASNEDQKSTKVEEPKTLSSITSKNSVLAQVLANPDSIEKFEVGKSLVCLPKEEIVKEWEKIKKMIDIYLEIPEKST